MQRTIIIATISLLASCGTMNTVPKSDLAINYDLHKKKTKCETIPRIYSGVKYSFCRLHAERGQASVSLTGVPWYLLDMAFISPFTDTVLLPVTIYQQATRGTLELERLD